MIQIKLNTPDGSQSLIIDEPTTPRQVLDSNNIVTDGADISIDGVPASVKDMNTAFATLGCSDGTTLSVVVKTGNA